MIENEWLTWRSKGLGASDVAKASTGRYGGSYSVVHDKLNPNTEDEPSAVQQRGHNWENPIADAINALTGMHVIGEQTWCEHGDNPHWRATVDGFLHTETEAYDMADVNIGVEIKTRHYAARDTSDYYNDQVQFQMLVTGMPKTLLAVATIDDAVGRIEELELKWIDADHDRQVFLGMLADSLWEHITNGTYPAPETAEALDVVKARFSQSDDSTVDLDDLSSQVERFGKIKQAERDAIQERKTLEAEIREALGRSTKGSVPGWRVSLSRPSRVLTSDAEDAFLAVHPEAGKTVLDRDKAAAIDPDFLNELKEPCGPRRLTIKEMKS